MTVTHLSPAATCRSVSSAWQHELYDCHATLGLNVSM